MKSVSIDFNNIDSLPILLIDSRQIKVPEEKLFNIYPKSVKASFPRLSVEDLEIPKSIVVKNKEELVKIRLNLYNPGTRSYQEESSSEFINFQINNFNFPYQVIFDPKQIEDYNDFENEEQNISFKVKGELQNGTSNKIKELDYALNLNFHKASAKPNCVFEFRNDFLTGFEYRKKKEVLLGYIKLNSISPFTYSKLLNCVVSVRYDKKYEEDIIKLGAISEIQETNPAQSYSGGLIPEGEEPEFDVKKSRSSEGDIELEGIIPNNDITIPVYIDLSRIPNPMKSSEHNVIVTVNFEGRTQVIKESFSILKDKRTTGLSIFLQNSNTLDEVLLENNSTVDMEGRYQWVGTTGKGQKRIFKLQLGNNAQNGQGNLEIQNLHTSFDLASDSVSTIEVMGEGMVDEVFLLNQKQGGTYFGQTYSFPNGTAPLVLDCTFRHNTIKAIPNDIASVLFKISFDYKTHKDIEFKQFNSVLRFRVERDPGPYWLAIDYGTSAIVTAFDNGAGKNTSLIDMQEALRALLASNGMEDEYILKEIEEYGSQFLSSNMLLRIEGAINASSYLKDLVYLSPLKRDQRIERERFVPYLKSLIGTEFLPNFNNKLDNFKYKIHENNNNSITINGDSNLLKVEDILTNAYHSLMRDFMIPAIQATGRKELLNKVVFTVPNTFTPRHNDNIRRLVEKKFPYFKKDYIDFISESDSVACFYLANWEYFNENRNLAEKDKLRPGTEYVLVYDMGAGTLDLTYMKVITTATGHKTIEVIGRLGTTTAGNYLDFVIADTIYDKSFDDAGESIFTHKVMTPQTADAIEQAIDLKNFAKDEVKPNLQKDDTLIFTTKEGIEISVQTKEIREDEKMKTFIRNNTTGLLANFFSLFKDQKGAKKGNYPLDTVLFSGRSSQFFALKEALKGELKNWVSNSNIFYIDKLGSDQLKNTVVQGALKYAATYRNNQSMKIINPNLQARYGILHIDPVKDSWQFKELLNPMTRPSNKDYVVIDGVAIYQYDTDVYDADSGNDDRRNFVDMSFTPEGYFVQSYSLNTAKDWAAGNTEYISVMHKFTKGTVTGSAGAAKVPVRIVVNKDNEMILEIGNTINDPQSPLTLDINESKAFKKSMWPYWA